ncbi:MAG: response regulator [candidate division Zixibacteria bacterium]|jgi:DNA-binding response OmpR family regulator|nr:response regulator [candidate division Zixibacteria bacterium]
MSYKIKIQTAKVLVVDDEPEITEIVETFLTEAGYTVSVENHSRQAIAKAIQFKPDVVILDIMMPELDGYAICQEIKQDPKLANVPIIFLTGKDRNDDMGRSFKAGGDMFIKKPFSCERLLEIVNLVVMSTSRH